MAYVSGIGIDLGAAAHATPFSVVPGALPTLPWLAALPSATPALGWLLLLAPVACGAAVALAVHRRSSQWPLWQEVCLLFGAVAGVAVVVAAGMAVAGGGLGPGRLSTVGPAPLSVAGACGALVLIGAVTTLGVTRLSQWVLNHRNPDPGAR